MTPTLRISAHAALRAAERAGIGTGELLASIVADRWMERQRVRDSGRPGELVPVGRACWALVSDSDARPGELAVVTVLENEQVARNVMSGRLVLVHDRAA